MEIRHIFIHKNLYFVTVIIYDISYYMLSVSRCRYLPNVSSMIQIYAWRMIVQPLTILGYKIVNVA